MLYYYRGLRKINPDCRRYCKVLQNWCPAAAEYLKHANALDLENNEESQIFYQKYFEEMQLDVTKPRKLVLQLVPGPKQEMRPLIRGYTAEKHGFFWVRKLGSNDP